MDSLRRQPDLDRLLYQSTAAGSPSNSNSPSLANAGHTVQATAATVLTPEKANASDASEREEVQIQLVDKMQAVTSPAEAAAIGGGAGENLDATSQLEEAGAALDLAQRRALLLGRTKQRHVCLHCGRECPSKHKLKRHLSTHSEQRPYNCHLCGKSFKWTEYLAKHMRTQHPGVEIPVFITHGSSLSPAHDCISPPTPTSTPPPLTSTPSHSHLTPGQSHVVATAAATDNSVGNCGSGSELKDGLGVGSASLGTGAIEESPIGCDTVYESCSMSPHMGGTSHQAPLHTAPLTKPTLPEAPPSTNELLETQLTASQQPSPLQHLQQPTQQSIPSPQRIQQPMSQQEIIQQQLQQQKQQQEQKEQQQQLLQQQIQQHQMQQQQLQQQLQQQQQQQQMSQQVLQQKQQTLQQVQPSQQQLQPLARPASQELLQATDLLPHSLQSQPMQNTEQIYTVSSPSSQTQLVTTETTTQMASSGGGGTHPLSHVLSSEAAVQYVGPGGETYEQTPSTSVVYTNNGFQESTSSQVFSSPVYNSQSVTQVYQLPLQSQSTLTSENFAAQAETFSPVTAATANYVTNLPPTQTQQQQGMEAAGFTSSIPQQPVTQGSGLESMEQMGVQNPESNILHMQAQITQSAYELQNVQMQSSVMTTSMQAYDNSGMIQPSSNFQDGTNTYQEEHNAYQEGTNTYPTGTNAYQMQEGSGYQDQTTYQEHSQVAVHSQTISSLDPSRGLYSTSQDQSQSQQMGFGGTADPVADVISYSQQIAASEPHLQQQTAANVFNSMTADTFQQTPTPGGGGGIDLQSQSQTTADAIALLGKQPQLLPSVSEVETVVTLPLQTGEVPPSSAGAIGAPTTSSDQQNSSNGSGKSNKKSQKPKTSIGIQCEVGPETFRALKEEEAIAKLATGTVINSQEVMGLNANPTSMLQKPVSASLLLSSSGTPPVHDVLNLSSPGLNASGNETPFTGQSDKIIRKFPCEVSNCSKAYVHRKDLIRHMSLRHSMSPQKLEPVVIETPEKPYTCHVGACRKSYFHQKDLRRHQRQCHSVTDNSNLMGEGAIEMTDADGKVMVRFPCDFPGCQRSYVHKKDLVRHKRVYHKDESKKPSIPVPVRFTEADLKRIRHEEKVFQDKETPDAKKPRLDSTGSIMSSGEDQGQFTDMSAIQITETVDINQLSTASPTTALEQNATQNQVSYETLSSGVREIAEDEQHQLTSTQLASLGLSQQPQQQTDQSSQLDLQRQIDQQATQQTGVQLPTILRRQRQGSNGQLAAQSSQEQQHEITLRSIASLLGGLQGSAGGSAAGSFDITQQAVAAFSSPNGTDSASQSSDSQQAAIAQFDPAAIISALSSVVNNPAQLQDMVGTAPPTLEEQQQVVSMENVASALQFLTSTSNST